ncbi:hypothetical protein QNA24_29870 [Rhodococcus qingshengii]|uniref:hypothetical protein n=1 Tax=Rhodococcus TaxID=1827 RepID=UPI001E3A7A6A|nr:MULTISPECIES: hypothetical protein [Rhodococcus]MCD2099579.1 hypothetical protein [Rhodococcus rhodochrous]MCD2123947.1 hypothetical protein [Rhodococcus rhodochrous]MCQ4136624.1 hypothetical protein [Rhodococcus rhodochrous]MDJ0490591.1 hypothetical protein [Rhodococcus qingshengii]
MTTFTLPDILDGTKRFMTSADQLPSPGWDDPVTRNLRRELLSEELEELFDADDADDLTEVVDALLDITVVAHGSRLAYGASDSMWIVGVVNRRFWDNPEARQKLRRSIETSAHWYFDAEDRGSRDDALIYLGNLIQHCANALDAFIGGELARACADEVTRSNLSKIVDGKVLRRGDGKILKPTSYVAPDIAGVLENAGLTETRSHDLLAGHGRSSNSEVSSA